MDPIKLLSVLDNSPISAGAKNKFLSYLLIKKAYEEKLIISQINSFY